MSCRTEPVRNQHLACCGVESDSSCKNDTSRCRIWRAGQRKGPKAPRLATSEIWSNCWWRTESPEMWWGRRPGNMEGRVGKLPVVRVDLGSPEWHGQSQTTEIVYHQGANAVPQIFRGIAPRFVCCLMPRRWDDASMDSGDVEETLR